jgi:hypothetical protein
MRIDGGDREGGHLRGFCGGPKHLARTVHDLYFEPKLEELRPRTV